LSSAEALLGRAPGERPFLGIECEATRDGGDDPKLYRFFTVGGYFFDGKVFEMEDMNGRQCAAARSARRKALSAKGGERREKLRLLTSAATSERVVRLVTSTPTREKSGRLVTSSPTRKTFGRLVTSAATSGEFTGEGHFFGGEMTKDDQT
jgi:hypothetical protein